MNSSHLVLQLAEEAYFYLNNLPAMLRNNKAKGIAKIKIF
jgi:hypothetical protein